MPPDQLSEDLASLRIQRDAPRPPRRWGAPVAAVLAVGALGAAYVFGRPAVEARLFKTEVAVTEISSVSPAQASIDVTSTGYVIPQVVAKVGAKIPGRVLKVMVREGEEVKAGQVLFELDPVDQKSAIAQAGARVSSARARALASRAALAEVEIQHERQKKLVAAGAAGAATAEDLGARADALRAQVRAAEAEVEAAQADLAASSVNLKNLTIPAPIDGTALTKPAQVGDVVGPFGGNYGGALVELADFASLMVESDVPEQRLHMIRAGGPAEVVLDSIPNKRFRGQVVEVSPKINRAKATAIVKVRFVDRPERIAPEMSARVSFLQRELDAQAMKEPPKTIVPGAALAERAGQKVVFVVDQGKVRAVPVTLGPPFGTGFEVTSGPGPGTRVVKDPPAQLADGQQVKERSS